MVCKDVDRRRLIELGWNDGMSGVALSNAFGGTPSEKTILRHLKEHAPGARTREVEVMPTGTVRDRVIALQTLQLNEVERQITLAKQRSAELNANIDKMVEDGVEGSENLLRHDWSEFFNILHKDNQAAIASILKAQGLTDKRELKTADLKLGLFEAMARNGLAPKAISGAPAVPALPSGDDDDGD